MNIYFENETGYELPFSGEEVAGLVCEAALEEEGCPYESQVSIMLTDNKGIRKLNRDARGIDSETDVLSFPNLDFQEEGIFDIDEEREADYFDPETGELVLGDIVISVDRLRQQAQSYGHSVKREFAFLVVHSMLHLCGYDHMEEEAAARMGQKQEKILTGLGITREITD